MADLPKQLNGSKIPISFKLGDKLIDGAVIKPWMFTALVDCVVTAHAAVQPKTFDARLKRLRMFRQVTYYSGNNQVAIAPNDVLALPIVSARTILAQLDDSESKAGKIIRDGDGVNKAITYELGTPIPVQGKDSIRELEFYASTYGDLEDVLAVDLSVQQTALLLSTVAKPLNSSLTRLPSWAVDLITVADGIAIARDVLPRFLESPVE